MPSRPPSPAPVSTPGTFITTRLDEPSPATRRMRPVVRSPTRASPPGRNAIPHGTCSPVAIVRRLTAEAVAVAVPDAGGEGVVADGAAEDPPPSPPLPQAARLTAKALRS